MQKFILLFSFLIFTTNCDSPKQERKENFFSPPGKLAYLEEFLGKPSMELHTDIVKEIIRDKKVVYYADWRWEKSFEVSEQEKFEKAAKSLKEILISEVKQQGGELDIKENENQYFSWEWQKLYNIPSPKISEFWVRANCLYGSQFGKLGKPSINVFFRHLKYE